MTPLDDESAAREPLLSALYGELRALAADVLRRHVGRHSLQPTALVHELYVRLGDRAGERWPDRAHFMAVASRAMRQILIDSARRQAAEKRGGGRATVTLADAPQHPQHEVDLVALSDALERLSALNERQGQIVDLRYLAGLTIEEVALVLDVSTATVKREWRMARAWLMRELGEA